MALSLSERAIYDALLDKFDAAIAQAFLDAVEDWRASADMARVIRALSNNDLFEAVAALHLDPAVFAKLAASVSEAYAAGGKAAVDTLPPIKHDGARFIIRFDPGNPRAEEWLRTESSGLIENIVSDQRTGIQTALAEGMRLGQNPRTTALDIIGRLDRTTGRRIGGIIGLASNQIDYVISAQAELASGDPKLMRHFLSRTLRDRRFDPSILAAIEQKRPVPADIAAKAIGRYKDRLLQWRGRNIARTETLPVLNAAQDEAFQQAIDKGAISAAQVTDTWQSASDSRVRHTHRVLNGQSIQHGEYFISPSGAKMRYPGDRSLGAGLEEIAGCRCKLKKRIDFLSNIH